MGVRGHPSWCSCLTLRNILLQSVILGFIQKLTVTTTKHMGSACGLVTFAVTATHSIFIPGFFCCHPTHKLSKNNYGPTISAQMVNCINRYIVTYRPSCCFRDPLFDACLLEKIYIDERAVRVLTALNVWVFKVLHTTANCLPAVTLMSHFNSTINCNCNRFMVLMSNRSGVFFVAVSPSKQQKQRFLFFKRGSLLFAPV